ncbi:hypothetical protein LG943_05820 [Streptomonospora sp. S1-112]|uniref:Uncharacterized protein n=1 Tax=Streptomonospora mangrovi TaxID=2883123 RepID=A0A9X3SLZ3_9ACTN|nr:hypothetical protein [Streptomonospora mangrovi]MDA0563846.1 hypothetical protein [Streptomonospora mangrovi]
MGEPDENATEANGTERDPEPERSPTARSVHVGGHADGPVVAGDYNLLIDARHGSSVTVTREGERPRFRRRDRACVLPRRQPAPLGREAETAVLAELVAGGGAVQVCGPPGIGKSTLLRHAATTLEPGPDGAVFVSAAHRHMADVAQEIFEACYDSGGYAPSWPQLRRLMAGVRITVYVDDADLDADRLRELADALPAATFVLAGREASLRGEAAVIDLEGLGRPAAARLLSRALERPLTDRERAVADDLWRATGGSPLPLLRAAGLARAGRSALPRPGAVPELLPLLLRQRDAAETEVLNLLATLGDTGLAPAHVAALTGAKDATALCARLADLGLAVPTPEGFRAAPDIGAALRAGRVAPFPVERLCRYLGRWAADPVTPAAEVADHSRVFERAADLATAAGRPDLAVTVGRAAAPRVARSLRFDAWGRLLGRGWRAAEEAEDHAAKAYFTHEEGVRCLVVGQRVAAAALLAQAAVLWHVAGDEHGLSAATQAHDLLPPMQHPSVLAGGPDAGAAAAPDDGAAAQAVADHMADLAADPTAEAAPGATGWQGPTEAPAADAGGRVPQGDAHGQPPPDAYSQPPPADAAGHAGPPGPDPAHSAGEHTSAVFADGGVSTASGAGAAGTGTGAAAGGSAASAALTTVLVGLAITGAVFVALEVAAEQDTVEQAGDSSQTTDGAGSGLETDPADEYEPFPTEEYEPFPTEEYEPPPEETETYSAEEPVEPTGLEGTWDDGRGGVATIVETAPGVYALPAPCGEPDVVLTGTDTQATGEAPLIESADGDCGPVIGTVTITITVAPDGDTAEHVTALPPGQDTGDTYITCYTCGTTTLTRVG